MAAVCDHDMLIEIATMLKEVRGDVAEVKTQFEAYATKDYVNASVANVRAELTRASVSASRAPDTVGGALSKFAASRTGVTLMVVTIVLALLGVLNMLGQGQITQDDVKSLVRSEIVNAQSVTTTGGSN